MRCLLVLGLSIAAACGGTEPAGTDGGADANGVDASSVDATGVDATIVPPEAKPFANFEIQIRPTAGQFSGFVWETAQPKTVVERANVDNCVFASYEPRFCDPACTGGTICLADNVCMAFPNTMSVGSVTVTGTTPALNITPTPPTQNYYRTDPMPGLLGEGVEAVLSGNGANGVAPFQLRVKGIAAIALPTRNLVATEHQDMTVQWTTANSPPGTEILIHFDSDHHGTEGYLECIGPDTGELTIPSEIIDALIEIGETGIGTYIENAYIQRRLRQVEDRPDARLVFSVLSHDFLLVETVRVP